MAENSSTACNIRRDNIQSKSTPDSHNSRRQSRLLQFLEFRRRFERQNSARERKPIHLPPIPLREAFSLFSLSSCLSLFVFSSWAMEAPAKEFHDALRLRVSLY